MVRVAGLREQAFGDVRAAGLPAPTGSTPLTQLQRICAADRSELVAAAVPLLERVDSARARRAAGIRCSTRPTSTKRSARSLDEFFRQRAFPDSHADGDRPQPSEPALSQSRTLPRRACCSGTQRPRPGGTVRRGAVAAGVAAVRRRRPDRTRTKFILLEDIIACRLPELFGGFDIARTRRRSASRATWTSTCSSKSRTTCCGRSKSRLRARQRAEAVRLEVRSRRATTTCSKCSSAKRNCTRTASSRDDRVLQRGLPHPRPARPDGARRSWPDSPDRDALRDAAVHAAAAARHAARGDDLFAAIADRDILLHHPFDSFDPVVEFIASARRRSATCWPSSKRSTAPAATRPIVRALMQAAENGKHVTALVELKARFDEANNISWARQMERAGVHVVFGFMDLKTHCKLAHGRAAGRDERSPLRPPGHRQLQPDDRAALHRPGPVHRRRR